MQKLRISGAASLDEITERVRDAEVTRHKFIGSVIQDGNNIATFQTQDVPAKPTFVAMGSAAPPNAFLDWLGEMQVEGNRAQVQVYRVLPSTTAVSSIVSQVRRTQQNLGITVDGRPGPETWNAIGRAIAAEEASSEPELADDRSERNIATLWPHVRPYARALYFKCKDHGIAIKIIDGTRTFAQQDALWRKGRNAKGKIVDEAAVVTYARGGYSNHNFGIGFDIGVFQGTRYITNAEAYKPVGVIGQELGLEWGGTWKKPYDPPHFQLRPSWAEGMKQSPMVAELRRQFPNGVDASTIEELWPRFA